MKHLLPQLALLTIILCSPPARAQSPATCPSITLGADVSFVPEAEARGDHFSDQLGTAPVLEILRRHGYSYVRLRLFNHPTTLPNDLAYTIAAARQAKALGYGFVLDLHYADDWADPGHQPTPVAWAKFTHPQLVEATYEFTRDTLASFRQAGVMPQIVQVGNEVTAGMMWPDGKLPDNWSNFTDLLLAGTRGVIEGSKGAKRPAIMLHIDKGGNRETTKWFFSHILAVHVPFDVIGFSFYPWWHGSIADLKDNLAFTANEYKKPIIVIETAYSWQPQNYAPKTQKQPPYLESPEGQRDFLQAVAAAVAATPHGLGKGLFWWEPAVDSAHRELIPRDLFDDKGHALPALHAFDACVTVPTKPPTKP